MVRRTEKPRSSSCPYNDRILKKFRNIYQRKFSRGVNQRLTRKTMNDPGTKTTDESTERRRTDRINVGLKGNFWMEKKSLTY